MKQGKLKRSRENEKQKSERLDTGRTASSRVANKYEAENRKDQSLNHQRSHKDQKARAPRAELHTQKYQVTTLYGTSRWEGSQTAAG